MIKIELKQSAYFGTDGLVLPPFQRNCVPYPSLSQDGGSGVARGWSSTAWNGGAGSYSIVARKQRIYMDGTGSADKNFSILYATGAIADYGLSVGDLISAAVDIDMDPDASGYPYNGAVARLRLMFEPSYDQYSVSTSTSGRIEKLDIPAIPAGTTSIWIMIEGYSALAAGAIEFDCYDVVLQRTNPQGFQGSNNYLSPVAREDGVGCVVQDSPAGIVVRQDGFGVVSNRLVDLDLTNAWWAAIEWVPNFNSTDRSESDCDLFNIANRYSSCDGVNCFPLAQMSIFKKTARPPTNHFLWARWDNSADPWGLADPTYIELGDFTFSAGDVIRGIMAYLPDGAPGIVAGKHLWLKVGSGSVQHDSHASTAYHSSQLQTVDRVLIGFQMDTSATDAEWANNGKSRQWYVQQGQITQAEVDAYMADSTSLGIKINGLYFPFDATNKLAGYGNRARAVATRNTASRGTATRSIASRSLPG